MSSSISHLSRSFVFLAPSPSSSMKPSLTIVVGGCFISTPPVSPSLSLGTSVEPLQFHNNVIVISDSAVRRCCRLKQRLDTMLWPFLLASPLMDDEGQLRHPPFHLARCCASMASARLMISQPLFVRSIVDVFSDHSYCKNSILDDSETSLALMTLNWFQNLFQADHLYSAMGA